MTILDQLKRDEGRMNRAYQDSKRVWTIGYGHNLQSTPISDAAMEQILRDDIEAVERRLVGLPMWSLLSIPRQGVLVNIAFNVGFEGLLRFQRMLSAVESSNWGEAAAEIRDSQLAPARKERLAPQMESDEWL